MLSNIAESYQCTIVVDIDGTLIPILVDFEKLRAEIKRLLGVEHPLRPLGESLAKLQVDNELKKKAWELVERAELESIDKLRLGDVYENIRAIERVTATGIEVIFVTMRSALTTTLLLSKLGLLGVVKYIITRDAYLSRKEQLEHVLKINRGKRLVFIGDTAYDEEAAKAVGLEFIKVKDYKELPLAVRRALEMCGGFSSY